MGKTVNKTMNTAVEMTAGTSVSSSTKVYMDFEGRDLLLIATNASSSAAASLTIHAGDGIQGTTNITFSVGAGKSDCIRPESGRFKITSGTNKGKIALSASAALKVQIIET